MEADREIIIQGVGVSPGITIGRAFAVARRPAKIPLAKLEGQDSRTEELERFLAALEASRAELTSARDELKGETEGDYSYILEAHLHILNDKMIAKRTEEIIKDQGINAEWALSLAVEAARRAFENMSDAYLRSRVKDVEYVSDLVMRHLSGQNDRSISDIKEKVIVVAHDLSPAETTQMDLDWVLGFVTDIGGPTSHTAIMAQAKGIPAVVGLKTVSRKVHNGDFLILDGSKGLVVINPEEETLHHYREIHEAFELYTREVMSQAGLPAQTTDGHTVQVEANIELAEEVGTVLNYGAEGIGLYRSEFFYITQKAMPTQDELYENFRAVARRLDGRPVNIRTLDIGGDKFASTMELAPQINPALGLRAIRFCLQEKDLFKDQLAAILRASAEGKVRIMFPLISGVEELVAAKNILEEVKDDLDAKGIPFDREIEVGIMVEVPSAVAIADLLAPLVDFFSIGTNDLIQYSLAIDRVNEKVAHLYQPLHPAVLRMIRQVVDAGKQAGIRVAMCGEMAGDPKAVPLLLGLGLEVLSLNAMAIPRVKQVVRMASRSTWRKLAKQALGFPTALEVSQFMDRELARHFPELFGQPAAE